MDSAMEEGSAIDDGSAIEDRDEGLAMEERGHITGTSNVTVLVASHLMLGDVSGMVLAIVVCTWGRVMVTFSSSCEDRTVSTVIMGITSCSLIEGMLSCTLVGTSVECCEILCA